MFIFFLFLRHESNSSVSRNAWMFRFMSVNRTVLIANFPRRGLLFFDYRHFYLIFFQLKTDNNWRYIGFILIFRLKIRYYTEGKHTTATVTIPVDPVLPSSAQDRFLIVKRLTVSLGTLTKWQLLYIRKLSHAKVAFLILNTFQMYGEV